MAVILGPLILVFVAAGGIATLLALLEVLHAPIVYRRKSTHCARCGYSRVGLAVETACPECGAAGPVSVLTRIDRTARPLTWIIMWSSTGAMFLATLAFVTWVYGGDSVAIASGLIAMSYLPTALIAGYIYARLSARYAALATTSGVIVASLSIAVTIGLDAVATGHADPIAAILLPILGVSSGIVLLPIVHTVIRKQAREVRLAKGAS